VDIIKYELALLFTRDT